MLSWALRANASASTNLSRAVASALSRTAKSPETYRTQMSSQGSPGALASGSASASSALAAPGSSDWTCQARKPSARAKQ